MNPAEMSTPAGEPVPGLGDVPPDPGGERPGVGELPRRPDLLQQPDRDRGPVERAAKVEKEGLHGQRMGPEGRIGPDAGHGRINPGSAEGLGDEHALGQDLIRRLQVGRGEAEEPSASPARDDAAGDFVRPAEQPGRLLDPAPADEGPHGRRADGPAAEDDRRDDVDAESGLPSEPAQKGGAAPALAPEAEAAPDDDLPGPELVPQDVGDERRRAEAGEVRVEGNDDDGVDAGPPEAGQALVGRVDHPDGPPAKGALRMGLEGQDERAQAAPAGQPAELREDLAVAEVEPVEIADRHGGGTETEAGIVEAAVDDHASTSSRDRLS